MPLIVLGIVALIVVVAYLRLRKPCDWVRAGETTRWRCRTCDAMTFSTTGGPPELCKRRLKDRPL